MITRRGIFGVLAGVVAAPMIVRAASIMPVRAVVLVPEPPKMMIISTPNYSFEYLRDYLWNCRCVILTEYSDHES